MLQMYKKPLTTQNCNWKKRKCTFRDRKICMDDERYFTYKSDNLPENNNFYTKSKALTLISVKLKSTTKFPNRLLVWISITDTAISRLFFIERPNSITASIYRKECVEKRPNYISIAKETKLYFGLIKQRRIMQRQHLPFLTNYVSHLFRKMKIHHIYHSVVLLKIFGHNYKD